MVTNGLSLEVHRNENAVPQANQTTHVDIAINLREFGSPIVDDMVIYEFRLIAIEAVGDEHRNIILPSVARSSG